MNNTLKFLLSSLIILGGYATASNCYCVEIENNNQVNQNNNYLVELCKRNGIEIDKNGNIIENERLLQDGSYLKKLYNKYDKTSYGGYITAITGNIKMELTGGKPKAYPTGKVYYHVNNNFFGMNNKVKPNVKSLVQYIDCDYIWWMATSIKTIYDAIKLSKQDNQILNMKLSQAELAQFPGLQNILYNVNQNTISLDQFFKYLINKVCMLGIQYSEKLKSIVKSNDIEELLNYSLIRETKNVLKNIQPIINWLNKFLTLENQLCYKEEYCLFIQHVIDDIKNINQLLDNGNKNIVKIQTNNEKVLLYCNYFRSLFILVRAMCCNNIEDMFKNNNLSKLINQYYEFLDNIRHKIVTIQAQLYDSTIMSNQVDEFVRLLSNLFPEDNELLNNCKDSFNVFNYLINKISLLGIEIYNEIQQCIATRNNNIKNKILDIITTKHEKLKKIYIFLQYLKNYEKIKQVNNLFNNFESIGVYKQILRQMNSNELKEYYEKKLQTLEIYLNNITDNENVINIWNDILHDILGYNMACTINGTWDGFVSVFVNVSEVYTDEVQDDTKEKLKLQRNKYQKINVLNAISTLNNILRSITSINNVDDITKVIINSVIQGCEQTIELVKYMQNNEFKNNKFETMEDDVILFNKFCKRAINRLNDCNMKLSENLQLLNNGVTTENLPRNLRR